MDALGWMTRVKESMCTADLHRLTEAPRLMSYVPDRDDAKSCEGRIAQFVS
jgi:hypothetical protein